MRSNNNILKRYCSYMFCVLAILVGSLTGCEDDSDMKLPLAVNSTGLKLPAAGGQTHIMVYSTGEWHAEFVEPVNWASINKIEEKGNSSILFSYAQNFGAARKVVINLTKDDEAQQISVVQEGITPTLKFPVVKYTLPKTSLPTQFSLDTNLEHNLNDIVVDILYDDEVSEQWISDVKVTSESFEFYALENNLGETRSARVTLTFVDGLDVTYSTYVDVIQSMDEGVLTQDPTETNLTKFETTQLVMLDGNMLASTYFFDQKIEYISGGSTDWISDVIIGNSGDRLGFKVIENETGVDRSAKIILSLETLNGKIYRLEHIVNQYASAFNVYTFDQLFALIPAASGELQITDAMAGISGIVISDAGNPNMESNPNTAFNKIDFTENEKTAYIQALDGSKGLRIKMLTAADNLFKRYGKATVALSGLTLVKEADPERYTLKGVTAAAISELEAGTSSDLMKKEKYIGDLTDADMYTFVTLKDVEFAVPYGAYLNANTGYVVKSDWNTGGITAGGYLDAVPTAFRDNKGNSMNLLINALVPWYKNALPKGSGTMSGIIVNDKLIRYGTGDGYIGRYSLRVLKEEDISLTDPAKANTIVEWNWIKNGNDISAVGTVNKDISGNVLPAIGTGKLYCTGSTTTGLGSQPIYFPDAASKGGINSAMHYSAKWWNASAGEGEAFVFNFSTTGISGNNFTINFTQGGGSGTAATMTFPAYWQVEYSTDGTNYTVLPNSTYAVRPLVGWNQAWLFANPGLTSHSFTLPVSLLGKTDVYVKLKAKSNVCATNTGAENGTLNASSPAANVRIGFVSFKYSN